MTRLLILFLPAIIFIYFCWQFTNSIQFNDASIIKCYNKYKCIIKCTLHVTLNVTLNIEFNISGVNYRNSIILGIILEISIRNNLQLVSTIFIRN